MKVFRKGSTNRNPVGNNNVVAAEIEEALYAYNGQKNQTAKGLVLGLQKFRKLKEQNTANLPAPYGQMAIIVDINQQSRISVF